MSDPFKVMTVGSAWITISALSIAALATGPQLITVTAAGHQATRVPYEDLRLDNAHGMKTLERRINRAARLVCNEPSGQRPLAEMSDFKACYNTAKADAMTATKAIAEAQKAIRPILVAR